ncbi:hypothetical protein [Comamonas guangdongensis]|uniref:Uncharacterized protein n=1 Tax=Comamonas guangdongensis TaxID=510515 RepID=A0ABV3ZU68_9BURK
MSLLRWFSRSPRHNGGPETTGSHRNARHEEDAGTARQSLREQRSGRREQLYAIVREIMVRVGILSAGYKFKVLSLDSSGQRFVVMVDLAPAYAADAAQQRNIEALIAELARARMGAAVHAVYWRVNGQIHAAAAVPAQAFVAPAAVAHPQARPTAPGGKEFEPIDALEMDAFKQAVAAAAHGGSAAQGAVRTGKGPLLGPGSGTEESGDFAVSGLGSLGVTQYGELR